MPIYAVKTKDTNELKSLVRADNKTAALRFVAESNFQSGLANQDDLLHSLEHGIKVQDAPEPVRRKSAA